MLPPGKTCADANEVDVFTRWRRRTSFSGEMRTTLALPVRNWKVVLTGDLLTLNLGEGLLVPSFWVLWALLIRMDYEMSFDILLSLKMIDDGGYSSDSLRDSVRMGLLGEIASSNMNQMP